MRRTPKPGFWLVARRELRWLLHDRAALILIFGVPLFAFVVLTAVFSSMVMAVQFAVQLARFGAKEYVSSVVSVSLVRELGPVLTALMVGGRVGAGIAAELGSMTVTEQVDGLHRRRALFERARIGQRDVLDRHPHQTARDVHAILAGFQHAGQPV